MSSDNMVTFVGNCTRDPELRFTTGGLAIANFGLAVNRRWQVEGEWKEQVSFVDCVCWQRLAENVAETVQKGNRLIVAGRIQMNQWETPEGDKRSKLEMVAENVGLDLRFCTVPEIVKNERVGGDFANREPDFTHGTQPARTAPASGDPGPSYDSGNEEPF